MEYQTFTHQKGLWISHENERNISCRSVCNLYIVASPPPQSHTGIALLILF
jgi:hypothetical protein